MKPIKVYAARTAAGKIALFDVEDDAVECGRLHDPRFGGAIEVDLSHCESLVSREEFERLEDAVDELREFLVLEG